MQSAIVVLRRLTEMGRDPEERRRLEAFLNGVLSEIKRGAADRLKMPPMVPPEHEGGE
jgi:hypothetical protein